MARWFLSYHSADQALAERLKTAIERKDSASRVFFAPTHLRAGGSWSAQLAQEIADATAFILLIGQAGIGKWQVPEYDEALDKWVKSDRKFPLIVVLLDGQTAPGLPFLRQLHWIVTPDPSSEKVIARVFDALSGSGSSPGELWRYTSPYRGLEAMKEEDSDYFFGRKQETVEVLSALAGAPDRLPVLIGNSGVGKSSLAQAGVLAALKRQAWPEDVQAPNAWPQRFQDSRQWCFLSLKPGTDPLNSLVGSFLDTWQYAATDPERVTRLHGWVEALRGGKATLPDLIDATERRRKELDQPKPPGFFLYVDQGEELYARAEESQRQRFSELLVRALSDPRLHLMMSMRSDFLGHLQADKPLFKARQQIDVPPLGEEELREIVSRPAQLLSARFESDGLIEIISRRTAEDSVKDVGALPLLSYTLDDMWASMMRRGDGTLRLPAQSFELGAVLVDRANRFLETHSEAEDALRRVLTLRLATVRDDGEPTRRRAARGEFTDEEWRLVSELADYPNRLLVTVTSEAGETFAEVAHEAIFRRWDKLRQWIAAEREFLAWRNGLEAARRTWQAAPEKSQDDALLMGLALDQAQNWLITRREDLSDQDRRFIDLSVKRDILQRQQRELEQRQRERLRQNMLRIAAIALLLITAFAGVAGYQWFNASRAQLLADSRAAEAERQKAAATKQREIAEQQRNDALLAQSRFLARDARSSADRGDAGTAIELALAALPNNLKNPDRPFVRDAEYALADSFSNLLERRDFPHDAGSEVWSAAFSPDGTHLLTASTDHTARIWNIHDGSSVVLRGHTDKVDTALYSPDGKRIVTASADKTARIWDAATGAALFILKGHTDEVRWADFSPDGTKVLTASSDKTARIWDAQTGAELRVLRGHTDLVRSAAFSPDGSKVLTASDDKTARIWDADTGKLLLTLTGHSGAVYWAAFSPDGTRVVTASADNTARIWNSQTGTVLHVLEGHEGAVNLAVFSPDGRRVVTTSDDTSARLWNTETGTPIAEMKWHGAQVYDAAFSGDGRFIVTTSADWTARVWDGQNGGQLATLTGHAGSVSWAAFSPDGNEIATASDDGTARLWDVMPKRVFVSEFDGHTDEVYSVVFSPDGTKVLTASKDETARVWDAATGKQLLALTGHEGAVTSAIYSPDGAQIATASKDKTVRVWDAVTGKQLFALEGHQGTVWSVAYSPDGARIVTASDDKTARIWDAKSHALLLTLKGHEDSVGSAVFSPDGTRILTSSKDKTARVWDATTGRQLLTLAASSEPLEAAFYSPDGTKILTTNEDEIAKFWNAATGAAEISLNAAAVSATFSRDGSLLATGCGCYDSHNIAPDLRIWNAKTGTLIISLLAHPGSVNDVAFSPDGTLLATASSDKTARLWRLPPHCQDLIDAAEKIAPRKLAAVQRAYYFLTDDASAATPTQSVSGSAAVQPTACSDTRLQGSGGH